MKEGEAMTDSNMDKNQRPVNSHSSKPIRPEGPKSLEDLTFKQVEILDTPQDNMIKPKQDHLLTDEDLYQKVKQERERRENVQIDIASLSEAHQIDSQNLRPDVNKETERASNQPGHLSNTLAYQEEANEDLTIGKRSRRHQKRRKTSLYSLSDLGGKEKTIFSLNVLMNVLGKLILYIFLGLMLVGALGLGTGVGYFAQLVSQTEPPSQQEMLEKINRLEQQSTIYYANGSPIANVQADLVRSLTHLDQISPLIIDGIIATEDEYFYDHPGVVPKAILRAAIETIFRGAGTGGSTITQQLVKQQMLTHDVTFFRKANEILLALRLENNFTKDDILTAYLNVSPFGRNNKGENVAGIAKAAEGIFGKSAMDVNLNQAAFLVGLPQDPYNYTPYSQDGNLRSPEKLEKGVQRMKTVLYRMYRAQKLSKEEYENALEYDITKDFIPTQTRKENRQSYLYQAMAHGAIEKLMHLNILDDGYTLEQVYSDYEWYNEYYFAAQEQLRTGGYKIYTTIDKEIYDQLQESAQAYEDELGVAYEGIYVNPETGEETYYIERVQTGFVVIENATGRVLGFIAGTDYENNQIDHAFRMRRSPGSTIKPLAVYGPAIDNDIINPSTVIPDTAFVYTYEDGTTWEPTNYGSSISNRFLTARESLLMSYNLPTIRIYQELLNQGVPIIDYLKKMGFNPIDSYTEEDTQNLAFSLGGVTTGPTVFEETRAFSTFANNGEYVEGYYIERIEDAFGNLVFQQDQEPVRVFSEDSNYLMVDIMKKTMSEGTAVTANQYKEVPGEWIAKTGISENSKDIWTITATPAVTIGSWIGYDSRFADYTVDINDGFGSEGARSQLYWARIVNDLYAIRPEIFGIDQTFYRPESIEETNIVKLTGTLPGATFFNGIQFVISQPLVTEVFKKSNPAPNLTYNFLLGATEAEQAQFWTYYQIQNRPKTETEDPDETEEEETEEDEDDNEEDGSDLPIEEVPADPADIQPETDPEANQG